MYRNQINKFTMAMNAYAFLGENDQITSIITELQDHKTALKAKCDEIGVKDTERNTIRKGVYMNKANVKYKAVVKALGVTGAVNAYARKIKDIELAEKSDIRRSDMYYIRETVLLSKLKFIKDLALANLQALASFGITDQKMNEYSQAIDLFENTLTESGNSFAIRKGNLKTISVLFKELDGLLESTDKLADSFIEEYPDFVNNYRILRRIKQFGLRRKKEEIQKNGGTDASPVSQTTS